MPQIPKRQLSYGEILEQQRKYAKSSTYQGTRNTPHVEKIRGSQKNGIVRTVLPDPFKCSKCEYIANGRKDLNNHWLDEHDANTL